MQQVGLAYRHVPSLAPWRAMVDLGLTTFAEKEEPTRSDSHAWSASPNYFFMSPECGMRPGSPGFETVRIEPALGPLEWASGAVPHPLGEISVSLRRVGVTPTDILPAGERPARPGPAGSNR